MSIRPYAGGRRSPDVGSGSTPALITQIGATADYYTLTTDDCLKYIKCETSPNNTSIVTSSMQYDVTNMRVIRYGDANLDGSVSILDATHIQRYLVGLESFNDEKILAADVDGDGSVTVFDATLIQYYLDREIDTFPVENE